MTDNDLIRRGDAIAALKAANLPFGYGQAAHAITNVPAALAASQPADPVTNAGCCQPVRVKHLKRGSTYRIIGAGKVQTETPLQDYDDVVVYQGEADGLMWIRSAAEFWDGRFAALEPAPRVNETPKSEHDSADVLATPPAPWVKDHAAPKEPTK